MPEFVANDGAAILIDAFDETALNHEINLSEVTENHDTTCFKTTDHAKKFDYGLVSADADLQGYPDQSAAGVELRLAKSVGRNRTKRRVLVGPDGLTVGAEAILFETVRNSYKAKQLLSGITSAGVSFNLSKSGFLDGVCLHAVHGNGVLGGNESYTLTLTSVLGTRRFGFRAAGGSVAGEWLPSQGVSALETHIEAQAEYTSCTVTGSLTDNMDGTFSGILTITFDGADGSENVPDLEITEGEVRTISHNANVTYNTVTLTPGQTVTGTGSIQTGIRASGVTGDSSVNIEGTSNSGLTNVAPTNQTQVQFDNFDPYLAFDGDNASYWAPGSNQGSIPINLTSSGTITKVRILCSHSDGLGFRLLNSGGSNLWNSVSNGGVFGSTSTTPAWVEITVPSVASVAKIDFSNAVGPSGRVYTVEVYKSTGSASLSLTLRYAPSFGNIANPTSSGGTVSTTIQGGTAPTNPALVKAQDGGAAGGLTYNLLTATGNGAWVDGGAASARGFALQNHIIAALGTNPSITVALVHTVDNGSGAPNVGAKTTLHTFDAATDEAVQYQRTPGVQVKRWTRLEYTISGTNPVFVMGAGLVRL